MACANAQRAGAADRYRTIPCSAFEVGFGEPYGIVLLTNSLHHVDRLTCIELLTKVRRALTAGGRAAALEFVPNENGVSPTMAAAFAMTMLATTGSGDAYTKQDYDLMYREAGFARVSHVRWPGPW